MVSTSNQGILTEYLVKYAALLARANERPADLLETLYMVDCYRAGQDLNLARQDYDPGMWKPIPSAELEERLRELMQFMGELARDRQAMWGVGG